MEQERAEFLQRLGNPLEMLDKARDIEIRAQKAWDSIRDEFFTKAGKTRKEAPSLEAVEKRCHEVDVPRTIAQNLIRRARRVYDMHTDIWSHIRPGNEEAIKCFGLDKPW